VVSRVVLYPSGVYHGVVIKKIACVSPHNFPVTAGELCLQITGFLLSLTVTAIAIVATSDSALAHPVTFKGGTALEFGTTHRQHHLSANHSFRPDFALGTDLHWMKDNRDNINRFELIRANWLARRWNQPDSQANLYLSGGLGNSRAEAKNSVGAMVAAQADWETRRLYTQWNTLVLARESGRNFQHYQGRVGIAPYLAEFDELNTFLILQANYSPQMNDNWRLGPVVRFFYDKILLEIGSSFDGKFFGTIMFHLD